MFTPLDWIVVGLYLFFSVFIGMRAARGDKGFADYMTGGGKVHWIAVGISIIATSVSATTFLGVPADVFSSDMKMLMLNFGAFISILVVGRWFIPRFRGIAIRSAYEYLEMKYSRGVRRTAAILYSLHLLLRTGILLYGPAIVLSQILDISLFLAILISAVASTIYTWYGGIKAVIWTDVLQFGVFFLGGAYVLGLVAYQVGGFGDLYRLAHDAGKTTWLDFRMDPSDARTFLSAGLAYAVLEVAIRGCDQQFVQRYLSCAGVAEANRSSILSLILGILVSVLFFWVGAALFVFYREAGLGNMPATTDPNQVFPWFILHELPPGATGLLVAAIYAAAMSSLSSAINALANTAECDIVCGLPEEGALRRARIWTVFFAVLGTGAALVAAYADGSLLKKALFFTGLFTGPLLGIFLLSFFRERANPNAVLASTFFGMASLLLFNAVPILPSWHPPFLNVVSWPWNPLIAMVVTVGVAILLDLIIPRKHVDITA